ncbi:MAG: serine/threonine protein kinase [Deltaproteobacteria bacterium]|nr:serine/threonine protein kinase [Deltaproteobacteria bacterium]
MTNDDSAGKRKAKQGARTVGYDEHARKKSGPFGAAPSERSSTFEARANETIGYEHAMRRLAAQGAGAPTQDRQEEAEDSESSATTLQRKVTRAKHSGATALQATELPPSESEEISLSSQPGRTRCAVLPSTERRKAPRPRYDVRSLLGEGGMGEVLLAHDWDIGREVALKRLLPERTDPAYIESFAREVRTVGGLEHPNIVPIHDVDVDEEGRYFFVMKRVEGETLEDIIERLSERNPDDVERYSFEVRIELFMGLLRALKYAHAAGVLHRDIKPANVMIGPYGEVMLMDWGISTRSGDLDASTREVLIGTPLYMSPEQARAENDTMDARSDLYSACVLFHELVTLRHYLGDLEEVDEVIEAVASRGWTWSMMAWHRPGPQPMPPMELYHFLSRGLRHEPARRWQSADQMLDELRRVLDGRVRVQCPLTFTKRVTRQLGRFVDRRPWLAFLLLATLLAGSIYGAVRAAQTLVS